MVREIETVRPVNRVDVHVGGRIHRRRLQLRYDLAKLASEIAMPTGKIAAIEAGEIRPTAPELYAFAQQFGVSVSYFFAGMRVLSH